MDIINYIFEFFFGKNESIIDSFFGKLVYTGEGYEGRNLFTPNSSTIDILIDEQEEGEISQEQVGFYKNFEKKYEKIFLKLIPFLEVEGKKYDATFSARQPLHNLKLVYLRIPNMSVVPMKWEIVFYEKYYLHHYFSVTMIDEEVSEIHVDG